MNGQLLSSTIHILYRAQTAEPAPALLIILLGLSALLAVYLAAWAHLHARVPGARECFFLLICVALYSVGYAVEISRSDIHGMLQAVKLEYLGVSFIPTSLLLFVLHFIRRKPASRFVIGLLLVVPAATLVLVLTQEHHPLYYINPQVNYSGPFPTLSFARGAGYVISLTYQQICAFTALILLLSNAYHAKRKYRTQAYMIAAGTAISAAAAVLYFTGAVPFGIDPVPFSLTLSGILFAFALFKYKLLELVPAARELALDSIRDALFVLDQDGRLHDLNKAAWSLPGAEALQIGRPLPDANLLAANLLPLLENGTADLQFSTGSPDGGERCYRARSYPISGELSPINGTAILISDITETAGLLKKLSFQASMDDLTGILNRRALMSLGEREMERARRTGSHLGIVLIDLDHFKEINDAYGHAVGDEVLKRVAGSFRAGLRSVDIVGRYGGEEFVVLLPDANIQAVVKVAERLQDRLAGLTIQQGGERLMVTASFGAHAALIVEGTTMDEVLKSADLALYRAKANGRNQIAQA